MFESAFEWMKERQKNAPGIFKLLSFLLFLVLAVAAIETLSSVYLWFFVFLIILDAVGTLAPSESLVSLDRAIFFLSIAIISMLNGLGDIFFVVIVILGLFGAIDFSFLLWKMDGSVVEKKVIVNRLKSYSLTILPSTLLAFLFLSVPFGTIQLSIFDDVVALGLAAAGALVIFFLAARFLLSFERGKSQ